MVGGPSIVFTRYANVGETKIRAEKMTKKAKDCKAVVGFDANSHSQHALW